MNEFYEWLYNHYAKPRLSNVPLSYGYHIQHEEWQAAAEKLSRHDRLLAGDLMNTLKDDWGTLAFACGIRFGLSLAADPIDKEAL